LLGLNRQQKKEQMDQAGMILENIRADLRRLQQSQQMLKDEMPTQDQMKTQQATTTQQATQQAKQQTTTQQATQQAKQQTTTQDQMKTNLVDYDNSKIYSVGDRVKYNGRGWIVKDATGAAGYPPPSTGDYNNTLMATTNGGGRKTKSRRNKRKGKKHTRR
jgi:hypothetical protein